MCPTIVVHKPNLLQSHLAQCSQKTKIKTKTKNKKSIAVDKYSSTSISNRPINLKKMAECEAKERKILVAVDAGEESMHALSWCLNNIVVSQNSKDTLILLYAKPTPSIYNAVDGTGYLFSPDTVSSMERYSNEVAESVMEKAKRLCKEDHNLDVKVETKVESGDPRDVICQAVDKLGIDLVVLGSHGYGLIKRTFLGSVSNHCAQTAKCPVLIVKRPKSDAPSK
ncbi:hypothetical protein ACSBR2_003870 [Camellia fascicularis]